MRRPIGSARAEEIAKAVNTVLAETADASLGDVLDGVWCLVGELSDADENEAVRLIGAIRATGGIDFRSDAGWRYKAACDELNDPGVNMTLEELDIEGAEEFAAEHDLPWPPSIGTFDWLYEHYRNNPTF